jgi:hypothetical protein
MNPPAGAHCLTALLKPFAHSRLMLPDSHPGLCRPETHPFRAHYPQDISTGTILGSAWGLLVVLVDGYVMNRIGFTKSNWKEKPSYLDLPLLGESKLT